MIWINGTCQEKASVTNRGFLFGDGVFTTIKVVNGLLQLEHLHKQRLKRDGLCLQLILPNLESIFQQLNRELVGKTGVLRVTLERGITSRGYSFQNQVVANWSAWFVEKTIQNNKSTFKIRWCETRLSTNHPLAGVKHLNRLEQVLARNEWSDDSFDDGLVADNSGAVLESTCANLFCVMGQELVTPPLNSNGVTGVMRQFVIQQLGLIGVNIIEKPLSVSMVEAADEIFLTNAIIGIQPVSQLENINFYQIQGNQYKKHIEENIMLSNR
jgi:4-amino-4-deoxychorismate lyase